MRTIETKAFQFSELSESAKEKAIEHYRHTGMDYGWYEHVIEWAKEIGTAMGIEIAKIYFSGFYSQGDGACFEGDYSYKKGAVKELQNICPTKTEIIRIAKDLQAIQRKYFYGLTASTVHRGHYYYSGSMDVRVYCNDGQDYANIESEGDVTDLLREFADEIYSMLEKEYEFLTSDETIAETIEANEYEFDEDGTMI